MTPKLALIPALAALAAAQQHELGFTLGALPPVSRSSVDLGAGRALEANYGYRLAERGPAALFGEVHFLASPLREVTSSDRAATRDVASLYVTPGIRVKLRPRARFSPWVSIGGGYALHEQSLTTLAGRPNPAPRLAHRAALQFGGGADFRAWRFVSLRAEIRDFVTGSPIFNTATRGRHNPVAGGGIVLRFGE